MAILSPFASSLLIDYLCHQLGVPYNIRAEIIPSVPIDNGNGT